MPKKKDRKSAYPQIEGAPNAIADETDKIAANLADLFLRYRREGWSDSEIEMGIAGQ